MANSDQRISVKDLKDKREGDHVYLGRYLVQKKLGEGTFGIVQKCLDKKDNNCTVAVKMLKNPDDEGNKDIPALTLREISILQKMQHPNIVNMKRYHFKQICLVFEFCEGDLYSFMNDYMKQNNEYLPIPMVKKFIYDILKGVDYIHKMGMMHRDLKPLNILLDKPQNGELYKTCKIAD